MGPAGEMASSHASNVFLTKANRPALTAKVHLRASTPTAAPQLGREIREEAGDSGRGQRWGASSQPQTRADACSAGCPASAQPPASGVVTALMGSLLCSWEKASQRSRDRAQSLGHQGAPDHIPRQAAHHFPGGFYCPPPSVDPRRHTEPASPSSWARWWQPRVKTPGPRARRAPLRSPSASWAGHPDSCSPARKKGKHTFTGKGNMGSSSSHVSSFEAQDGRGGKRAFSQGRLAGAAVH